MDNAWQALTALGHEAAEEVQIGPYRIAERFDVALASLALRRGQDKAFAAAAKKAGTSAKPHALTAQSTQLAADKCTLI